MTIKTFFLVLVLNQGQSTRVISLVLLYFETGSHKIAQEGLELVTLLPHPP